MGDALRRLVLSLCRLPHEPAPPAGAGLRVFRASLAFLRYRTLPWIVAMVAVVPVLVALWIASVASPESRRALPLLVSILFTVVAATVFTVSFWVIRLDWELRWYMVTDRSLRVREGVLSVREMTVTFANVQNVSVEQGPLQRAFGIADVRVESAGGGAGSAKPGQEAESLHAAFLRGVDDAESLRDLILGRLRQLRDSGLGDAHPAPPPGALPVAVLREVRDEARRLQQAAEGFSPAR